jgi:exosome complex RNA-binding protein Csl4
MQVHISQLGKDRVENVNDVVTVGDEVYVKVCVRTCSQSNSLTPATSYIAAALVSALVTEFACCI